MQDGAKTAPPAPTPHDLRLEITFAYETINCTWCIPGNDFLLFTRLCLLLPLNIPLQNDDNRKQHVFLLSNNTDNARIIRKNVIPRELVVRVLRVLLKRQSLRPRVYAPLPKQTVTTDCHNTGNIGYLRGRQNHKHPTKYGRKKKEPREARDKGFDYDCDQSARDQNHPLIIPSVLPTTN